MNKKKENLRKKSSQKYEDTAKSNEESDSLFRRGERKCPAEECTSLGSR